MGKAYYLCPPSEAQGIVAEWLGSALQKLLQRFESARYLQMRNPVRSSGGIFSKRNFLVSADN